MDAGSAGPARQVGTALSSSADLRHGQTAVGEVDDGHGERLHAGGEQDGAEDGRGRAGGGDRAGPAEREQQEREEQPSRGDGAHQPAGDPVAATPGPFDLLQCASHALDVPCRPALDEPGGVRQQLLRHQGADGPARLLPAPPAPHRRAPRRARDSEVAEQTGEDDRPLGDGQAQRRHDQYLGGPGQGDRTTAAEVGGGGVDVEGPAEDPPGPGPEDGVRVQLRRPRHDAALAPRAGPGRRDPERLGERDGGHG
ncbi:hypothetical protein [Geodermatophilus poikilotrophus]|uniref:hypothetical protein n=1 Tax=Geodermatophilus poikilotrophus TaxID=1333667 RepID=UPI00111417B8|nr:hypothetical protein [Geodermatophilus poikilotrophus]